MIFKSDLKFIAIEWNARDAFIGKLPFAYGCFTAQDEKSTDKSEPTGCLAAQGDKSGDKDAPKSTSDDKAKKGPLPYLYFLAVPLLKFDNDEFIQIQFGNAGKFSHGAWPESKIVDAVGAFAHHAFLKKG